MRLISSTSALSLLLALGLAVTAIAQPSADDVAAWQKALYPNGLPMRHNPIADGDERPEFIFAAEATLPSSNRTVAVFAERLSRELPFDRIYRVQIALAARDGQTLSILDRLDVTEEIELFTDFPGNFLDFRALVTPLPSAKVQMVAVELWDTLHGTGALSEARHLFYAVSAKDKLSPVLELDTYSSGRSGDLRSSTAYTVAFHDGERGPEVLFRSRAITWEGEESAPDCGPETVERYRFSGTTFVPDDVSGGLPEGAVVLPRLDVEDSAGCGDSGDSSGTSLTNAL